nr:hypothetical protein [Pseudomonas sp. WS 5071]
MARKLPRDRVVPESDRPFAQVKVATVMPWSSDQTAERLAQVWGFRWMRSSSASNSIPDGSYA